MRKMPPGWPRSSLHCVSQGTHKKSFPCFHCCNNPGTGNPRIGGGGLAGGSTRLPDHQSTSSQIPSTNPHTRKAVLSQEPGPVCRFHYPPPHAPGLPCVSVSSGQLTGWWACPPWFKVNSALISQSQRKPACGDQGSLASSGFRNSTNLHSNNFKACCSSSEQRPKQTNKQTGARSFQLPLWPVWKGLSHSSIHKSFAQWGKPRGHLRNLWSQYLSSQTA